MKHILHLEYDDQEDRMTTVDVPNGYVTILGMLEFARYACQRSLEERRRAAIDSSAPGSSIPGPDGIP